MSTCPYPHPTFRPRARVATRFAVISCFAVFAAAAPRAAAADPAPPRVRTAFNDDCETLIVGAIDDARDEILVAIYTFTRARVAERLAAAARRDVRVRIKYDSAQADEIPAMRQALEIVRRAGGELIPVRSADREVMHNKFVVIDRRTVVTGSFNYTVSAALYHWENVVRIDDPATAAEFAAGWERIRSGGRRAEPASRSRSRAPR